ncbi:hypothetical protein [Thermomonospora cellulosilytica]|uniref:Uncharacterized protein n=1 Tax=Thermomonospora cellulosilytica TaxID=1411118 RepID=A0A7W3R7Y2_9ACTN|nr:hypothetical protein [Thermomonospora cellulosilytica]MBA9002805.1 hypothetical protein [Thermomonospora cellulosilytica]
MLLLCCALSMHGLQVSANPLDLSGLPISAMSAGHGSPAFEEAGLSRPSDPDRPGAPHSDHPGGEVCLGLLAMVGFAVVLWFLFRRYRSLSLPGKGKDWASPVAQGRSPPARTVYELAVLRL